MRRYLIVANQTLGGEDLLQAVKSRLQAGDAEFWVLVPATPVDHTPPAVIPMPVMGRAPTLLGTPAEARQVASDKLQAELQRLRALGATVDGAVGPPEALDAVAETVADRQFDEIIVLTLPTHVSRWLHQDLPRKIEHRFHVPVTHVATSE